MALINNPNSWNGGTAVFNSAPITETYLKLAAHREAKNQALDQYHQKQLERVDRDGVRDQDAEQFQQKVNDWNQHWQMNKDNIRKGNIKSQIENDKLYGDLLGFVKQSKRRDEKDKAAMPVGISLKNKMGTTPDQFHADIQANSLPIGAPGSKEIDLNPYVNEPDDWDVEKGMKAYDRIPRVPQTPVVGQTDPTTGKRVITQREGFDDKAKANIAAIAGSEFQNDRSFNKAVQTAVADPNSKQMLEQVYQDQMGKKPEHPEEYATAFALSKIGLKETQKVEDDKIFLDEQKRKTKLADDIKMEGIRQAGRVALQAMRAKSSKELADYRHKLSRMDKAQQENALDAMNKDLEDESNKPEHKWNIQRDGKVVGSYKVALVPQSVKNAFAVESTDADGKKIKVYPTHFGYMPDGNIKVIFTSGGEGSDRMQIDKKLSTTITKNEFKAALGKGLGLGVNTVSHAEFSDGNDEENDSDEDDNNEVVPAIAPTKPAAKSDWKSRAKKIK